MFPGEEIRVLSIGTGELVRAINYEEAKDWGKVAWALPLMSCVFDGVSDAADYQMRVLLGDNYIRLQVSLESASDDLDNASKGNIELLMQEAKRLLVTHESKIESIFR